MGCDLHLHTEIKINGKWECYGSPSVTRWYELFYKMAGVRGTGNEHIRPISPPKGLPEDCSTVTQFDAQHRGEDGHSHSWFSAEEIVELEEWWKERYEVSWEGPETKWGWFFGNSWGDFIRYPEDTPEGIEDVRFVFWFDC